MRGSIVWLIGLIVAWGAGAQETKVLLDFESPADLKPLEFKQKSAVLSAEHVTHGAHSLRISANEYIFSNRLPGDWSGYDALEVDAFVEGDQPVSGTVLVADAAWQKSGGSYWNRHNGTFNLRPGANTISIPVNGLYRGEAGSRNNDIKSNIDPKQIVRLDLGFKARGSGQAFVYLDHLRLMKESRPEGILALDLGPGSQTVFPGFTAIGPGTVFGKDGATAGLKSAASEGYARDDVFPTRLYRDALMMDGQTLIVGVPPSQAKGTWHAWVMFNDLGYWGGEQATFRTRKVLANGEVVFTEDRGAAGPTDYLYRFERLEPRPGDALWPTYMAPLFAPKRFTCTPRDGRIELRFQADAGQSSKVAAVVLYPESIRAEAEKWLEQVEARNRAEFESRAVFVGGKDRAGEAPAEARAKGYWIGFPGLEQDVTFLDAPGRAEGSLAREAARGQRVSFTFAVRALKDFAGPVRLTAADLKSDGGTIAGREISLSYVHQGTIRNFNDIAYSIGPDTVRPVDGAVLELTKGLTRQFWVTVHVPEEAKAGRYTTTVTLTAGDLKIDLPLTVDVQPFALDEPDFVMGYFGTDVPRPIREARGADAWRDLFRVLREAGMNSFSGGPGVRFSGLDADGKPRLDFAACDEFMRLAREAGFTKEVNAYGGPGMVAGLHDSYVIGETGRAWERKTGKSFPELLKIVWSAVRDHAKEQNWLPIAYEMTDEPRVLATAQKQVELMRLYRENVPFVNIGGSYSVDWKKQTPLELAIQDIFKTLNWSSLNVHSDIDLAKAKEFGKTLYVYNQGRTRYSFGAYQWAEMHKEIKGRMQWHLEALHGYQFFDLDGREPDTAMIRWGSRGILPTLALQRCREGADDVRYAVTLWNLAQKHTGTAAGDEAIGWLEGVSRQIAVGQNRRPEGFMEDEAFRGGCAKRIRKMLGE